MTTTDAHSVTGLPNKMLIDGQWREGAGGTFTDRDPPTGEPLIEIAAASADDVDAAVAAARAQLEGVWGAHPGSSFRHFARLIRPPPSRRPCQAGLISVAAGPEPAAAR